MIEAAARATLASVVLAVYAASPAQQRPDQPTEWNQPVEPFRIIGNVYYVGAAGVSAFLIRTPEGSILLDGGLPETAPRIVRSIAALGFDIRDVKFLLNSHAHYDHSGGLAELKRLTGAVMVASHDDARALVAGSSDFKGVAVDRTIADGDKVSIGGAVLTAHVTPGHTKGCTTWTTTAREGGRDHRVVFHCSTSVEDKLIGNRGYPHILWDYQRTFERFQSMQADVFLGAHPSFFDMQEKRRNMKSGAPNPFVDSGELSRFNTGSRKQFEAALAKERSALPAVEDPDEYAIYRMLAQRSWPVRHAGAKQLIVQEETSSGLTQYCTASIPPNEGEWRRVLERWQVANESSARIQPNRNLGLPYRLLTSGEIVGFFTRTLGRSWEKFYADHPSARAYFVASRVGFSADRRRAIVYFSDHCGSLCAHGQIYTLENTRTGWRPVTVPGARLCNWIS